MLLKVERLVLPLYSALIVKGMLLSAGKVEEVVSSLIYAIRREPQRTGGCQRCPAEATQLTIWL